MDDSAGDGNISPLGAWQGTRLPATCVWKKALVTGTCV